MNVEAEARYLFVSRADMKQLIEGGDLTSVSMAASGSLSMACL
jgi:hypothetical protein